MWTSKDPTHCPKCMSEEIYLGNKMYKKDVFGEDTDTIILGTWFCDKCGEVLGRKMNQYENDLDPNSL